MILLRFILLPIVIPATLFDDVVRLRIVYNGKMGMGMTFKIGPSNGRGHSDIRSMLDLA